MDNLTHTLIGVHLARSGPSQKHGKGVLLFFMLMSNIPDLDFIYARLLSDNLSFLVRRMWTHSIFGFPLLSLLVAFLFHLKYKQISVKTFFLMGLAATAAHVLYDLANSYGVVVLYPFFSERFELAWLFIIDPFIWGILIIPLLLISYLKKWVSVQKISIVVLVILGLYTCFCGVGRMISHHILKKEAAKMIRPINLTYVFPEALGPHRFRGVIQSGTEYTVYQIKYFKNEAHFFETFFSDENDPDVIQARNTKEGQKLDWFYKIPIWQKNKDGVVTVFDVRFRSTVLFRGDHIFAYAFGKDKNGSMNFLAKE